MIKHKRLDRLGQNISPTVLMIMAGVLLAVVLFVKPDGISAKTVKLGEKTGKTIASVLENDDETPATPKEEYATEWYAWVSKDGKTLHCTVDEPNKNECLEGRISKKSVRGLRDPFQPYLLRNITTVESDKIVAETYLCSMFLECDSLTNVDGLANWDTSSVLDMNWMFRRCCSLTDISGLSNWDTGNVTNTYNMFEKCRSLKNVDALNGWNVKNVKDMTGMFRYCPATPPSWF